MKWLCLLLLLPRLALGFPVNTTPLDTFTGSQDPLAGIWTNNVNGSGNNCKKLSDVATKVTGASNTSGCYITTPFNAKQEAYVELVDYSAWAAGENGGLLFCVQAAGIGTTGIDGYNLRFTKTSGTDHLDIFKITDNGYVQIGTDQSFEMADGDDFGVEVVSLGVFDIWVKDGAAAWAKIGTITDPGTPLDCANSYIGIQFRTGAMTLDNFGGGNILTPSNPFIRLLIK